MRCGRKRGLDNEARPVSRRYPLSETMSLRLEWHGSKDQSNLQKHGVGFIEAGSVFSDPLARIFEDTGGHSDELREIIIGHSSSKRLLLVCFTELATGRIRVISARRATKKEQRDYEENIHT